MRGSDDPRPRSTWTSAGRFRMHARVADSAPPGSPRVVLVHGLGVSSRYMIPTIRSLAHDCHVFAPDLPGYGRSAGPRDALDIPLLADALDAWLEAAHIGAPDVLLGNSMGCQILVDLAVRRPARVRRLVLVGPTMDAAARTAWQQFARLALDSVREAPSQPFLVAYDYAVFGFRRFRQTFYNALSDRVEDKLPRVLSPTLVVRGERDPIAPQRWVEEIVRRLPSGRLAVVPGAAHTVNYMAPDALAELVRAFLRSTSDVSV
jgi:2-hydroxy-6-oxonona-2,4-dienedioate hydrolase